jgi:hypothetical protein
MSAICPPVPILLVSGGYFENDNNNFMDEPSFGMANLKTADEIE